MSKVKYIVTNTVFGSSIVPEEICGYVFDKLESAISDATEVANEDEEINYVLELKLIKTVKPVKVKNNEQK